MRALLNFCRLMTHRNYPGVWRERQKKKGGECPLLFPLRLPARTLYPTFVKFTRAGKFGQFAAVLSISGVVFSDHYIYWSPGNGKASINFVGPSRQFYQKGRHVTWIARGGGGG